MKKYILVFVSLVLLYACDERGILENSNDVSYIYFTKNATNDSTSTSFFFYPEGDISVPVAMNLSGRMFDEDCSFKLEVVKEETTLDAANYDISEDFVFHKDRVADTIYITFKNSEILSSEIRRVVFRIADSEKYSQGDTPFRTAVISISDIASRPEWWNEDEWVIWANLGEFTIKKFELLIEANGGIPEITLDDSDMIRRCALTLKRYLEKYGPFIDENGDEVTVPVIG